MGWVGLGKGELYILLGLEIWLGIGDLVGLEVWFSWVGDFLRWRFGWIGD